MKQEIIIYPISDKGAAYDYLIRKGYLKRAKATRRAELKLMLMLALVAMCVLIVALIEDPSYY